MKKMNNPYEQELENRIDYLTGRLSKCEEAIDNANKRGVHRFRVFVRKPTDDLSYYLFEQIFFNIPQATELKKLKSGWTVHNSMRTLSRHFFDDQCGGGIYNHIYFEWDSYIDSLMEVRKKLLDKNIKVFDFSKPEVIEENSFDLGFCLSEVICADKLTYL